MTQVNFREKQVEFINAAITAFGELTRIRELLEAGTAEETPSVRTVQAAAPQSVVEKRVTPVPEEKTEVVEKKKESVQEEDVSARKNSRTTTSPRAKK